MKPSLRPALALGLAGLLLAIPVVRADEGTAVLVDILAMSIQQLSELEKMLSVLRKGYEATKRVAGYADDARRAYEGVRSLNAEVFRRELTEALEGAYPDIGYFRREAS